MGSHKTVTQDGRNIRQSGDRTWNTVIAIYTWRCIELFDIIKSKFNVLCRSFVSVDARLCWLHKLQVYLCSQAAKSLYQSKCTFNCSSVIPSKMAANSFVSSWPSPSLLRKRAFTLLYSCIFFSAGWAGWTPSSFLPTNVLNFRNIRYLHVTWKSYHEWTVVSVLVTN